MAEAPELDLPPRQSACQCKPTRGGAPAAARHALAAGPPRDDCGPALPPLFIPFRTRP